jgi:hypothetical protein
MWYYFEKQNETPSSVTYAFGYESREAKGLFEYSKNSKKITIINKHEKVNNEHLEFTVYKLIEEYGIPDKQTIAYG